MNYPKHFSIREHLPEVWYELLDLDIIEKTERQLNEKIEAANGRMIFPYHIDDVFKIFRILKPEDVRVVLLGQDPYMSHRAQANGIAFSVNSGVALPPSLKNIFRELPNERKNGDLIDWVEQGVFMLNCALTVYEGRANSHADVWRPFTDEVIRVLQGYDNIVYGLWGAFAQRKGEMITNTSAFKIETSHPSPLGVTKTDRPFKDSKVFDKINAHLKEPIKW